MLLLRLWSSTANQPGALLDELVLVSVLAPLYSAAFDASGSRAGGCRAPVSEDQWRSLYDLSEERGEFVRLDWEPQPPHPVFSDTRAVAAWNALSLPWKLLLVCV